MNIDINKELIFCSDSVLRVKSNYKDKDVFHPLLDIQSFLKKDETFILKVLENIVSIEQDTTLSNIVLALEPWADILYNIIGRDVKSYCQACRSLTTKAQLFDFLEISKGSTVSRKYSSEKRKENQSLNDYFNRKRTPTNDFNTEVYISMSGFNIGDNSNYSTSVAFNEIKNTPVFLTKKQNNNIYLPDLENVDIDGFRKEGKNTLFYSEAEFSFLDLLKGLFQDGLFYEKPLSDEGYDKFNEMLAESVNSIKQVDKTPENVVSIFGEDNKKNDDISNDDKQLEVSVAPGAFDSLIDHFEQENIFWNNIFENIASKSDTKTGKLNLSERDTSYRYEKIKDSDKE